MPPVHQGLQHPQFARLKFKHNTLKQIIALKHFQNAKHGQDCSALLYFKYPGLVVTTWIGFAAIASAQAYVEGKESTGEMPVTLVAYLYVQGLMTLLYHDLQLQKF